MFKNTYLLAKTLPVDTPDYKNQRTGAIFTGHINAVIKSAVIILDHFGDRLQRQFGLTEMEYEYFRNTVILSAFLHDLGKCSEHFQQMVYLKSEGLSPEDKKKLQRDWNSHGKKQMLRHEVLSAVLALTPQLKPWLENPQRYCLMTAICGAMGHHLKLGLGEKGQPNNMIADIQQGTGSELRLFTHHEDFKRVLKMAVKYLGLTDPPEKLPQELWPKEELEQVIALLREKCADFARSLTEEQHRFIAVVKALVIAADLAGSAIPVVSDNSQPLWKYLENWIKEVLDLTLTEEDLDELIRQRLADKPLRPFQAQIANTPTRVTIVKAGCGTGKTIGAYAWARNRAIGRKLFFCYPTTGTASQGYLDYAVETEIESSLMHSRASIDLEEILSAYEEDDADGLDDRLEAMTAWQAKLIVCTVDTVLGLVQNNRKPLFSFPAIAQGAFVFDEVHSFDQKLFGALLRFLETFRGAPILLMSASLNKAQEQAICEVIRSLGESVNIIQGEQKLEVIPRYRIIAEDNLDTIWERVQSALENNQKVLWVTNTVKNCVNLYRQAEEKLKTLSKKHIKLRIYHSRYRYKDRLERHKEVIEAFKCCDPCLAITTQVCEMSLDLSADLLVSQVAPAYALIQRMGRLNRYVYEDELGNIQLVSGRICPAIFYLTERPHPYSDRDRDTGKFLIHQLCSETAVSQQNLAEICVQIQERECPESASIWLDKSWETYPRPLRDGGYTMTVIMERDLEAIKLAANQRSQEKKIPFPKAMMQEIQRWTIPVRMMENYRSWKRWKFYYRVPDECINYSEITGAEELCS